jgi:hypothetical protein
MTVLLNRRGSILQQPLERQIWPPNQNCHPERSRGTSAVLILPVPLGAFQPRAPAPNEGLANEVTSSQNDSFVDTEEESHLQLPLEYGDLDLEQNCHSRMTNEGPRFHENSLACERGS